ncbi:fumarylacetoacetate hydrolase family protein [Micromonospora sp. WMMD975]|uniref:fumarylacetoacetate hydrolase family protein n=1 Tax=Micromonospora sp. WMMD975 TaxID=3016087 RepID=UPI00249B257A|nr:fumarylacetoacetate hydrolase family protein [Micromonospora sp. WMMD975]WFE33901.1 fumarylacetoacetate hydrolase family protein [Micromonospora sp. WMMD975]
MKLTTAELVGGVRRVVAVQADESLVDLAAMSAGLNLGPVGFPRDMLDLISAGRTMTYFLDLCQEAIDAGRSDDYTLPAGSARYLAPIPRPTKIVCVNSNRANSNVELLEPKWGGVWPRPQFFLKAPSAVIGHEEHILVEPQMGPVQPEGEMCLIIGRQARRLTKENALDHVAGVSLLGDYSASTFGLQDGVILHISSKDGVEDFINRPMARAKGVDTFSPIGPWLIPLTALPDLGSIRLTTDMVDADGKRLTIQDGTIGEQRFTPAEALVTITEWMTLEPGDVVALGAVSNVPGRHLRDNNMAEYHNGAIELHGSGIGTLRNPITVCADGESTSLPPAVMQRRLHS